MRIKINQNNFLLSIFFFNIILCVNCCCCCRCYSSLIEFRNFCVGETMIPRVNAELCQTFLGLTGCDPSACEQNCHQFRHPVGICVYNPNIPHESACLCQHDC